MNKKWHKSKIDIEQLKIEIGRMSPRSYLYKTLKIELSKLGFWKNRQRGNPKAGYAKSHKRN